MYIYKFYNIKKDLLYIGKTEDLLRRMNQHFKDDFKEWKNDIEHIEFSMCSNKTEMDLQEIYLINRCKPKYNIRDNREDDVSTMKFRVLNFRNLSLKVIFSGFENKKFNPSEELELFKKSFENKELTKDYFDQLEIYSILLKRGIEIHISEIEILKEKASEIDLKIESLKIKRSKYE